MNRTRSWVGLREHERIEDQQIRTEEGVQRQLTIDDAELFCYLPRGTMVEREVNCNSQYMLEKMPIIGAKIRRKMPFIPQDTTINLIMDNAGGHGMQEAIDEYKARLQREFNIRIKHQAPWSPETNALDLGIWCSIQSAVEKLHRNR